MSFAFFMLAFRSVVAPPLTTWTLVSAGAAIGLRFAEALEALFGRCVDLLTVPSIRRSPYLIEELNATRQLIYEA